MLHKIDNGLESKTAVVFLHGFGSNECDLIGLGDLFSGAKAISLQAPIDLSFQGFFGGHAWFPLNFTSSGIEYKENEMLQAVDLVNKELKELRSLFDKFYLCGFSQGAIMSHAVFLRGEVEIDGIAGLSGRYNELVFDKNLMRNIEGKPVFLSHGTEDTVIPAASGREIRKFYEGSGAVLDAHEYSSMGHEINFNCQKDLQAWFEKLI